MSKAFGRRVRRKKSSKRDISSEAMTLQDYLTEAEICCEHARVAGRQRRFGAARGLFQTATSLYRRAIDLAGTPAPALLAQLRGVEAEMSAYAELARSLSRPLH